MMELEVFPKEMRRRVLEIGQVLRMEMFPEDIVHPKKGKVSKEKRFVIIGKHDNTVVAALLINSQINEKRFIEIGPYQHLISSKQYDFLDHDSFVDGYLIREFNAERVLASAEYLGHLQEDDVRECIAHAVASPKIKPYMLKRYGLNNRFPDERK